MVLTRDMRDVRHDSIHLSIHQEDFYLVGFRDICLPFLYPTYTASSTSSSSYFSSSTRYSSFFCPPSSVFHFPLSFFLFCFSTARCRSLCFSFNMAFFGSCVFDLQLCFDWLLPPPHTLLPPLCLAWLYW